MSTYFVKSNLLHDGAQYQKGDTIDLSGDVAEALLKDGIITRESVESDPVEEAPERVQEDQKNAGDEAGPETDIKEENKSDDLSGGGTPVATGEGSIDGDDVGEIPAGPADDITPGANL